MPFINSTTSIAPAPDRTGRLRTEKLYSGWSGSGIHAWGVYADEVGVILSETPIRY